MQDFRNLSVWQMSRRLTTLIYQLTADYPATEEFGLKAQMRRASVSICANIAEGCGRGSDAEFRRFLLVAMGSACELECEAMLSLDLVFITEAAQNQILAILIDVKRMLSGLIACLVVSKPRPRAPVQSRSASEPVRDSKRPPKASG